MQAFISWFTKYLSHDEGEELRLKMMSHSSCIDGCLDVVTPVDSSTTRLLQWAEADKEFLRTLAVKKDKSEIISRPPFFGGTATPLHTNTNYVGRQLYLRSYTFSKEEEPVARAKKRSNKWLKLKSRFKKDKTPSPDPDRSCSFLRHLSRLLFLRVTKP